MRGTAADPERVSFLTGVRDRFGFGAGDDAGDGTLDSPEEDPWCFELTFQERLIGFAITYAFGMLCSVLSWFRFGDLRAFGILMTTGNLCSIGGTLFLMGPMRQFQRMFDPTRAGATVLLFVSMAGTFAAAFILKSAFLTLLCCVAQYLALIWYTLSYIPYARSMVLRLLNVLWSGGEETFGEQI